MAKSKVLVVGGTGYMGKRIVKACLAQGHTTYVLQRPEIGLDIDKLQMLLSFKEQGAHLVEGSFSDHQSLVDAVKLVDVVICTMSGVHFRSHNILMQLRLVEAIKEAGTVKRSRFQTFEKVPDLFPKAAKTHSVSRKVRCRRKASKCGRKSCWRRFLPSEFGMDPARMGDALEPGRVSFDEKMIVRKAIEGAKIPHTYICGCCFAGYFVGNLSQLGTLVPPKEKVNIYGNGNMKVAYMDEDDIATYTIKTIDDPRALDKTVYVRPPENILTQRQLIEKWENLRGRKLEKCSIPAKDFLASMKDMDYAGQVGVGHFYHVFYEGCLTNFEAGKDGEEASELYPEVEYTRMESYLKRYV
ncbi:unnamed protein product [Coffea canephora]|uniref:NmrA-like domain-containing protein n=1 Tax=Coffea canephora TaxID=49390 RepID=A0A068UTN0_COFCA|nr:unnamed protein product [Coffea canephora]